MEFAALKVTSDYKLNWSKVKKNLFINDLDRFPKAQMRPNLILPSRPKPLLIPPSDCLSPRSWQVVA